MSEEPVREIKLVEDFYDGLLEIQAFADEHSGKGRQVVGAIMDFAYNIIAPRPHAFPAYVVTQHPEREYRRAVFRKKFVLNLSRSGGGANFSGGTQHQAKTTRLTASYLMLLRRATPADLPTILGLIGQVVPLMNAAGNFQWTSEYPNAAVFEKDIAQNHLWVAELAGELVGVAALTQDQDPEYADADWDAAEPALVTHRLAVAPTAQGKGVAQALLQQAEHEARGLGLRTLRVDTNSENAATQRLFPKLGYRFAGEIRLAFRPGLRFFCYEKRLD